MLLAERRKLQTEINDLQQKLNDANESAIEKEKKHTGIIQDYKQIIQRLEQDMTTLNETLELNTPLLANIVKISPKKKIEVKVENDEIAQQMIKQEMYEMLTCEDETNAIISSDMNENKPQQKVEVKWILKRISLRRLI
ncbi:hypothetical protein EVAR_68653_1 [Eumeta japonica]|uniref:Uncharacterized protein n=1 Tax=Eumeta variegata TaxID=151549 RepID=A0A4C1SID7_EUMVA|nr:hypothetical protein EVAR_68653_1 [Eumeta japonica]